VRSDRLAQVTRVQRTAIVDHNSRWIIVALRMEPMGTNEALYCVTQYISYEWRVTLNCSLWNNLWKSAPWG
jgi:hypothetical protein